MKTTCCAVVVSKEEDAISLLLSFAMIFEGWWLWCTVRIHFQLSCIKSDRCWKLYRVYIWWLRDSMVVYMWNCTACVRVWKIGAAGLAKLVGPDFLPATQDQVPLRQSHFIRLRHFTLLFNQDQKTHRIWFGHCIQPDASNFSTGSSSTVSIAELIEIVCSVRRLDKSHTLSARKPLWRRNIYTSIKSFRCDQQHGDIRRYEPHDDPDRIRRYWRLHATTTASPYLIHSSCTWTPCGNDRFKRPQPFRHCE